MAQGRLRAVSKDGATVLTIDTGNNLVINEEPIECHSDANSLPRMVYMNSVRDWLIEFNPSQPVSLIECPPGNCPCGDRPRAGCVFHDPRLQTR